MISVIEKVSQYYKILLSRLNQTEPISPTKPNLPTNDIIIGKGQIIYNPSQQGFFGIRDDKQNQYYIVNIEHYLPQIKDRQRVRFVLEILTGVGNVKRWGQTAKLHSLKFTNQK